MADLSEKRTAKRQRNDDQHAFGEQGTPVPTTEAANGEVQMDPAAAAPAQDAAKHVEDLDNSAGTPIDPLVDPEMVYFGNIEAQE